MKATSPAHRYTTAEPKVGADNYELREEIAHGGMATVIEAVDGKFQRTVAAKLMTLDADDDPRIRERFLREVRILAMLQHPNIVPIHDIVWEQGEPLFYTMKLVQGRSLETVLDDLAGGDGEALREFRLERLLTIFTRVCDGVAFAHSQKVIHRDLKPANIMVGAFGEVMVMDWGVAKHLDAAEDWLDEAESGALPASALPWQTMAGGVVGTPSYMPPEQKRGEVDERSDIFALGGILYAILTLRPPPQEADPGKELTLPAEPLRHLDGGRVPAALAAVCHQALAPDPARRYHSVAALAADIEAYRAGHATRAELAGPGRRFWLLVRRQRALFAALAVLLLLSGVFIFRLISSEEQARASASAATASGRAARQSLGQARTALAEAAYRDRDHETMLSYLKKVPEDLRDSDWHFLQSQGDKSNGTIPLPEGGFGCGIAAHPKRPGIFAVAVYPGLILLVDARAKKVLSSFPIDARQQGSGWYHGVHFSPDGQRLLVAGYTDSGALIYEPETGKPLVAWSAKGLSCARFSPDGTRTLEVTCQAVAHEEQLTVREAATGHILWQAPASEQAHFMANGDIIAPFRNRLRLLSREDGHELRTITDRLVNCHDAVLSPDETVYYIAYMENKLEGINLADGSLRFERSLGSSPWTRPYLTLSADGRRLISAVSSPEINQRSVLLWDAASGTLLHPLQGGTGKIEGICSHPLSNDVLVSGPELRGWSPALRMPTWEVLDWGVLIDFWGDDQTLVTSNRMTTLLPSGQVTRFTPQIPSIPTPSQRFMLASSGNKIVMGFWIPEMNAGMSQLLERNGDEVSVLNKQDRKGWNEKAKFSRDGKYLSQLDLGTLLRNLRCDGPVTELPRCELPEGTTGIPDVSWLAEGRLVGILSSASGEQLVLWDSHTGKILRSGSGRGRLGVVEAAPDGRTFAEAGNNKHIRIRDAATFEILQDFRAHDEWITALAMHPTKPLLASASADLTIRLWDLRTYRMVEELRSFATSVSALTFSPSGDRLAAGSAVSNVLVWNLSELLLTR